MLVEFFKLITFRVISSAPPVVTCRIVTYVIYVFKKLQLQRTIKIHLQLSCSRIKRNIVIKIDLKSSSIIGKSTALHIVFIGRNLCEYIVESFKKLVADLLIASVDPALQRND